MLRKILISAAGFAFVFGLFACQSDEGVTNPGITDEEDDAIAMWGYVYDGPNPVVGATVTGYDYDAPPPPSTTFGPVYTDGEGCYGFYYIQHLKYRQWHLMRIHAEKGSKEGWSDYFVWDGQYSTVEPIYIE